MESAQQLRCGVILQERQVVREKKTKTKHKIFEFYVNDMALGIVARQ